MTIRESTLLESFSRAEPVDSTIRRDDTSVVDTIVVLLRQKRLIAAITLVTTLAAGAAVLLRPPSYLATATILPPQQAQTTMSALMSGAMGGLAGGSMDSQLGLKNPADLYIGILKSRTISDEIIGQFQLQKVYGSRILSTTRKTLSSRAAFAKGKESMIMISVKDPDPQRAAAMANAFVEALYRQTSRLALTGVAQKRLFFERELRREKDELADAEVNLESLQQSTGLVIPAGQAELLIRSSAQFRAEITSRQVQLQAMRSYATDENPQVQTLKREISTLQMQLAQAENAGSPESKLEVSGARLPQVNLEYVRKLREVKYHEALFELIAKQYEGARIDESKEAPLIQVVDQAVAPDKPNDPPAVLLITAAGVAGLILGCLAALTFKTIAGLWTGLMVALREDVTA